MNSKFKFQIDQWVTSRIDHTVQNVTIANGGQKPKIFWTKRGVISLGFFIKSGKAKQFRRWAEDLILQKLEHLDSVRGLEEHTKRPVQVHNSKQVNSYYYKNGGVPSIVEHSRQNAKVVSGLYPSQLIALGKSRGLKSKYCTSGKEVLRALNPPLAAQLSMNDELVQRGLELTEANALSSPCLPLLRKISELKMLKH